ncbi:MAG: PIN domain-containing protein [Balneolaceae bacterium]
MVERKHHGVQILRSVFNVALVNQEIIDKALALNWPDFEDAIHYEAARVAGCQAIVTRNEKDFTGSELPVLSPHQFLKQLL